MKIKLYYRKVMEKIRGDGWIKYADFCRCGCMPGSSYCGKNS